MLTEENINYIIVKNVLGCRTSLFNSKIQKETALVKNNWYHVSVKFENYCIEFILLPI